MLDSDNQPIADGILSSDQIKMAIANNVIKMQSPPLDGQIQPASLDLRLSSRAWRIQTSFLPGANATVSDKLANLALHEIDLTDGAVLEKGCVYLVELQEKVLLCHLIYQPSQIQKAQQGALMYLPVLSQMARLNLKQCHMAMKGPYMLRFHRAPFQYWCAPAPGYLSYVCVVAMSCLMIRHLRNYKMMPHL